MGVHYVTNSRVPHHKALRDTIIPTCAEHMFSTPHEWSRTRTAAVTDRQKKKKKKKKRYLGCLVHEVSGMPCRVVANRRQPNLEHNRAGGTVGYYSRGRREAGWSHRGAYKNQERLVVSHSNPLLLNENAFGQKKTRVIVYFRYKPERNQTRAVSRCCSKRDYNQA